MVGGTFAVGNTCVEGSSMMQKVMHIDWYIYDECDLRNMDLSERDLHGAHFIKADARGAYFIKAQLVEADFYGADLRNAYFVEADLRGAYFEGADLRTPACAFPPATARRRRVRRWRRSAGA